MNKQETQKILGLIIISYPDRFTEQPSALQINVWNELLSDLSFADVSTAVKKWIMTERFPPVIADIRKIVADANMPGTDQADEAWGKLKQAIRKFGHMDSEEAIQTLPELAQIIVKRFTWSYYCMMPIDEVSTYYAQFRNAYECEYRKQRERKQIPEDLQKALQKIGQGNVKQIESLTPKISD